MSAVQLSEISFGFGRHDVLCGIDLALESGEYVVILGASGCGKTSLLKLIAGLLKPATGTIRIAGQDVTRVAPRHRDVALVPQHAGLYPHLPIGKSIGLGIREKISNMERGSRVEQAARIVEMDRLLDQLPEQLSGGQLRRAAVAKAIATRASVRLLDEPLSAIDANLRYRIEEDLSRLHQQTPGATIHVTHDGAEAERLADRIAVIDEGRIVQCDTPEAIRKQPVSPAVAAAIGGSPFRTVRLRRKDDDWVSESGRSVRPTKRIEGDAATVGFYEADQISLGESEPGRTDWVDEDLRVLVREQNLYWFSE